MVVPFRLLVIFIPWTTPPPILLPTTVLSGIVWYTLIWPTLTLPTAISSVRASTPFPGTSCRHKTPLKGADNATSNKLAADKWLRGARNEIAVRTTDRHTGLIPYNPKHARMQTSFLKAEDVNAIARAGTGLPMDEKELRRFFLSQLIIINYYNNNTYYNIIIL